LSTPNAIEVPGSLLAAIQQRLARDDVNAILRSAGPLANWDRQQLELARKSWQDQLQKANGMIKAINARLAVGQDSPADARR
jgi:hypothetical protein